MKKVLGIVTITGMLAGMVSTSVCASPTSKIDKEHAQAQAFTDQLNEKLDRHGAKTGKIDASTASNDELAAFGIPCRPTDTAELAQWNKIYSGIKQIFPVKLMPSMITNTSWNQFDSSPSWCGGVNRDNSLPEGGYSTPGYQLVEGGQNVPDLSKYMQLGNATEMLSQWVGIGGFSANTTDSVIQCGVTSVSATDPNDTNYYRPGYPQYYFPWLEDYSNDPSTLFYHSAAQLMSMYVNGSYTPYWINAGETVAEACTLNSDGSQMGFIVTDTTNGRSSGVIWIDTGDATHPKAVSNYCAEWINERPHYAGAENLLADGNYLANYGTTNWFNCRCAYGTGSSNTLEYGLESNYQLETSPMTYGVNEQENFNGTFIRESTVSEPTSAGSFSTTWNYY